MPEYKYDVFLSHKSTNKPSVMKLAGILQKRGLRVWVDADQLQPGLKWRERLEQAILDSRSVAVIVGADGIGEWQDEEVDIALRLAVKDDRPIIGVLIPGAPDIKDAQLPATVTNRTIVDLRESLDGPGLKRLIWGITGIDDTGSGTDEALDDHDWRGTRAAFLDPRLLRLYRIGGSSFLDEYYDLLKYFQHPDFIHGTLGDLLSVMEGLPDAQGALASVSGFSATGKSCLLNCIYLRQLERFQAKETRLAPVLINLRNYLNEDYDAAKDYDPTIAGKMAGEATSLCEEAKQGADGVILLVDGCEEYYRHPGQEMIDAEFKKLVEKLSVNTRVIKVVGVGQSDHAYPADRHSHVLAWAEREDLVQLCRLRSSDANVERVLAAYVKINGKDKKALSVAAMKQRIQAHRIDEIDLFVLSIIEESIRKKWATEPDGLEALYASYCREHVIVTPDSLKKGDVATTVVKKLAADVFNFFVRRPFRKSDAGSEPEEEQHTHAGRLYGIPHLHASVKEYLIADHIIDLIVSSTPDGARRERFIYPYGINRFVRSIINRDETMQGRVLAAIVRHYKGSIIRERIHLAYLLGRFSNSAISAEAKQHLHDYLRVHQEEKNNPEVKSLKNDSIHFRQRLLLERTLSISAIYLGDRGTAKAYLMTLLGDSLSDDLNRGFHLEYYEDAPRIPDPEVMIAKDDTDIRPKKTFEVLLKKLDADYSAKTSRAMTSIELHTLCSLCLHRHVIGRLSEHKRVRLLEFLHKFHEIPNPEFPAEFDSFLDMVTFVLSKKEASIGSVFSELHALKKQPRAGWTATHRIGDEEFDRECPDPESVSDHIWGCLLIAEAFLPETHSDVQYSKREILRMLLIHDLAETFTGDIPSFQKAGEHRREEDRLMRRISALATFPRFSGMATWRTSWEKFHHRDGINAGIANDIDTIENYCQLMQYLRRSDCSIPDAKSWAGDVLKDLATDIGKEIFHSMRQQGASLLQWFEHENLPAID